MSSKKVVFSVTRALPKRELFFLVSKYPSASYNEAQEKVMAIRLEACPHSVRKVVKCIASGVYNYEFINRFYKRHAAKKRGMRLHNG